MKNNMESMLKTKKQGLLIVLSGPSGCGKNTIINKVMENNKIFGYLFLVLVGNLVEKKKMGLITTFYQEKNLSKR
jgi:adenylylsulfate kinase-like enzyme